MERMAWGGKERDPETNKWVPSRQESWQCIQAMGAYQLERRVFERQLQERHGAHLRWVKVIRPERTVDTDAGVP